MPYLRKLLLVFLTIASSIWIAFSLWEEAFYTRAIPADLRIFSVISIRTQSDLLSGCGGVVFRLSRRTSEAIEKQGLSFFITARQGRGYPHKSYYSYEPWQKTPVPDSWVREGMWPGLGCAESGFARIILAAARAPGAYYTTKSEGELLVIPSLGLVVLTFFG